MHQAVVRALMTTSASSSRMRSSMAFRMGELHLVEDAIVNRFDGGLAVLPDG
jgi:hypothetical protein